MLTFAEEILLLTLDDEDGVMLPIRESTMEYVLTGAVLMDLAFANRIDTDPERLMVIDPSPTGNPMLDRALERITAGGEAKDTKGWIETLSRTEAEAIRETALSQLVERGILERRDEKFLWVFRSRRYPTIDGRAEREAKLRITGVLLSDDMPDPRDIALIALADVCNILREIFTDREIGRAEDRIRLLRKMDLIGREVSGAVAEIERSITIAMAPH